MAIIEDYIDDVVNANTTDLRLSPIVPNGQLVVVKRFGCAVRANPGDALVAIQWGSGGTFTTIRGLTGVFELTINRAFTGDGVKRFRLVRINKTALSAFEIAAWYDIFTRN